MRNHYSGMTDLAEHSAPLYRKHHCCVGSGCPDIRHEQEVKELLQLYVCIAVALSKHWLPASVNVVQSAILLCCLDLIMAHTVLLRVGLPSCTTLYRMELGVAAVMQRLFFNSAWACVRPECRTCKVKTDGP